MLPLTLASSVLVLLHPSAWSLPATCIHPPFIRRDDLHPSFDATGSQLQRACVQPYYRSLQQQVPVATCTQPSSSPSLPPVPHASEHLPPDLASVLELAAPDGRFLHPSSRVSCIRPLLPLQRCMQSCLRPLAPKARLPPSSTTSTSLPTALLPANGYEQRHQTHNAAPCLRPLLASVQQYLKCNLRPALEVIKRTTRLLASS